MVFNKYSQNENNSSTGNEQSVNLKKNTASDKKKRISLIN